MKHMEAPEKGLELLKRFFDERDITESEDGKQYEILGGTYAVGENSPEKENEHRRDEQARVDAAITAKFNALTAALAKKGASGVYFSKKVLSEFGTTRFIFSVDKAIIEDTRVSAALASIDPGEIEPGGDVYTLPRATIRPARHEAIDTESEHVIRRLDALSGSNGVRWKVVEDDSRKKTVQTLTQVTNPRGAVEALSKALDIPLPLPPAGAGFASVPFGAFGGNYADHIRDLDLSEFLVPLGKAKPIARR